MKKFLVSLLFLFSLMLLSGPGISQPPPPPGSHGSEDNQPAPAPLGGGAAALLIMAGAYGAHRAWKTRKKLRQ